MVFTDETVNRSQAWSIASSVSGIFEIIWLLWVQEHLLITNCTFNGEQDLKNHTMYVDLMLEMQNVTVIKHYSSVINYVQ